MDVKLCPHRHTCWASVGRNPRFTNHDKCCTLTYEEAQRCSLYEYNDTLKEKKDGTK